MRILTIIFLFLIACFVLCSRSFALRPNYGDKTKTAYIVELAMRARSEIRSKNISVMDIHFNNNFKERVIDFFKTLGFEVERYNHTNSPKNIHRRFDLVFWNAPETLDDQQLFLVVELLRADGILFLDAPNESVAQRVISYANINNLSHHREGKVIVIKRMFDDYNLFFPIVQQMKAIMETEKAA